MKPKRDWTCEIKLYHLKIAGFVNRVFGCKKNIQILECGCGWGVVGKILTESGYSDFRGFDIDEPKVDMCVNKLGLKVWNESIASISYPDNKADCVICSEVLEHLDDVTFVKGLAEIRRVMKEGAVFIVTVPSGKDAMRSKKHKRVVTPTMIEEHLPDFELSKVDNTYGRLDMVESNTLQIRFLVYRRKYGSR
jgi:2-polyprenyl-3-methyl-5-hydroxy-6-metoxy-1,4-benzoquinol methylase